MNNKVFRYFKDELYVLLNKYAAQLYIGCDDDICVESDIFDSNNRRSFGNIVFADNYVPEGISYNFKMWVYRKHDGTLYLYREKPSVCRFLGHIFAYGSNYLMRLPPALFPDITHKMGPIEVDIDISKSFDTIYKECNET